MDDKSSPKRGGGDVRAAFVVMADECFECGAGVEHWHHVVPRSRGGKRMVPLCGSCHGEAHGHHGLRGTRELTRAALASKRARGERTGCVPMGSRVAADGVHLEADPAEAEALALVRELRAEGLSIRAIAGALDARGVPARGGRWHPTTVARLLRRVGDPLGRVRR